MEPITPEDSESSTGHSVAFCTVGCRLNQCETAQMQEALTVAGFKVVDWEQPADVRVVNTCTVTAKSDRTCRHDIHAAKRLDPGCLLVVTGCLSQVAPESVAAIPGVDLVLGNPDKRELAAHLAALLQAAPPRTGGVAAPHGSTTPEVAVSAYSERPRFENDAVPRFHGRTRAFLKVQTGCDNHCAYCIVPVARGPARSMPKGAVLEQVRLLVAQGHREVVLTGVDLGSWGADTEEGTLADLLTALLGASAPPLADSGPATPSAGVGCLPFRLRLSSVEPLECSEHLLEVVRGAGERVAQHLHLPLQSGSDAVLTRMGRPYTALQYLAATTEIAGRLPDAAIGADVIVGFPGETEAEFQETMALVEASPLTYLHVFGYSDRPGTPAAGLHPKIPPQIIKERSERLRAMGARMKAEFRDRLVGSDQTVLVLEEHARDGRLVGLTGNYMEVLVPDDKSLPNTFVRVTLECARADGRWEVTMREAEA